MPILYAALKKIYNIYSGCIHHLGEPAIVGLAVMGNNSHVNFNDGFWTYKWKRITSVYTRCYSQKIVPFFIPWTCISSSWIHIVLPSANSCLTCMLCVSSGHCIPWCDLNVVDKERPAECLEAWCLILVMTPANCVLLANCSFQMSQCPQRSHGAQTWACVAK